MNKALFTFIKIAFVIMLILLILYGTVHLCRTCYDYGNESERLTCHQLVNLKQTEHVKDGMLENIQMLHQLT